MSDFSRADLWKAMLDKSTVHANDVMVAQFVFLFLARSIFRETSTEMDVETVSYGKKKQRVKQPTFHDATTGFPAK